MYVAADSTPFDSNCISPGTEFMQQLTEALDYYVNERISSNPFWSDIEVVLSGAEAPGEGEHKIMEYIRAVKVAGKMPPNTRHCLYGLDADLIMLGLVSHEPHFFLLREKVDFSAFWKKKGGPRQATFLDTVTFGEFELLSIGLLREYLNLDVGGYGNTELSFFDIERVVDDFVFMLMLVGNDFLPHLPTIEIADGSVCGMMYLYKRLLVRFGGYLSEEGKPVAERVELFVAKLSLLELRALKKQESENKSRGRERQGPKTLFTGTDDLDTLWGFAEIHTEGMPYDIDAEIAKCRKVTHSTVHNAKKRKYYSEKLGKEFMATFDKSLHSLTSNYLEGILWTMKYYFEGCQSWRWYYAHHYAPFPSDLTCIAEKTAPESLTFKLEKPFLPLQQLMSVLPPASAACVPLPFRKLMTSPASPIHDFYNEDFKTDLNGKRNEWEAVVLLPFVDEKRLFKAIASVSVDELTDVEKRRNSLGESLVYRFSKTCARETKSPFPQRLRPFISKAEGSTLKLPSIPAATPFPATWVLGTHPAGSAAWVSDLPTLFPVPHSGRMEKISINLFGYGSRKESCVVTLGSWKAKNRDFIFFDGADDSSSDADEASSAPGGPQNGKSKPAHALPETVEEVVHVLGIGIGSQVWTQFPWRNGGTVEAIIDENKTIRRAAPPLDQLYTVEAQTNQNEFENNCNGIATSLMDKSGVDIDKPKVLVEVLPYRGVSDALFGNPLSDPAPLILPLITILTDAQAIKEPKSNKEATVKAPNELTAGGKALFTGRGPFFGSVCTVKELYGDGNAKVAFQYASAAAREIPFGYDIVEKWQSQRWKSLSQIAQKVGISIGVANSFLGSIRVRPESGKDEIDLGLGIKYASRGLLIPGYAKVNDHGTFFFSEKTTHLLSSYKEAFPDFFAKIEELIHANRGSKGAPVYSPNQLFRNVANSNDAVRAVASWISASDVAVQPLVPSASQVLHRDAVFELERNAVIARLLQEELTKANGGKGLSFVVNQRQLRSGSESLDWESDPESRGNGCLDPVASDGSSLRLGDRVVNRLAYTGIPFGLRGTVVGVHQKNMFMPEPQKEGKNNNKPQGPASCTVEVVFDREFISGGDLNGLCNTGKGKAVPPGSLYTIRPDRDNRYYTANYNRVAKNAKTKPTHQVAIYNRRKAIGKAAEESYKESVEKVVVENNSKNNTTPNINSTNPPKKTQKKREDHKNNSKGGKGTNTASRHEGAKESKGQNRSGSGNQARSAAQPRNAQSKAKPAMTPAEDKEVSALADTLKKAYGASSSTDRAEYAKALAAGGYQPLTATDAEIEAEQNDITSNSNSNGSKSKSAEKETKADSEEFDGFSELWDALRRESQK